MADLSIQELLQIVQERDSIKGPDLVTTSKPTELGDFISEFNIRTGLTRIPNYVIFFTYKHTYGGELSKVAFFRQFKKDFIQRRTGTQRVYLLDEASFDMSREGLIEAKAFGNGRK